MVDYVKEIERMNQAGLRRTLTEIEGPQERILRSGGLDYLNFSSNNYLGLANHPELREAARRALDVYGMGAGAARLVNGSQSPAHRLEERLAEFKNAQAALVFNSGYHANVGALSVLAGEGDAIFSDALNHASMIDGIRLSKAERILYRHNDVQDLRDKLSQTRARLGTDATLLIATESVFSMDGDLAPLKELSALAEEFQAWLYLDEAHATGVFGQRGAGRAEAEGLAACHERLIQMGTLGKALGCFGAYIAAPKAVVDFLLHRARTFVYTTALPPSLLEAALAALRIVSEQGELRARLWQRMGSLKEILGERFPGKKIEVFSPIFPLRVGDPKKAVALGDFLREEGLWVQAIRPPTVPEGTSRLRLTLMATHTEEDLLRLGEALERAWKKFALGD